MNQGAVKACRSDRRLAGLDPKVPREVKRAWATLSQRERARLHGVWKLSQIIRGSKS